MLYAIPNSELRFSNFQGFDNMTPYGIIYRENPYSYEQSVSIWQKKFGVMKLSLLIKIALAINVAMGVLYFAAGYILKDSTYFYIFPVHFIANFVSVYMIMRSTNIKSVASQCMQKTDVQLVFYGEKLVFTTPYSRSEYYYDELVYCKEKNGCITIVVDEGVAPISLQKEFIKTGDYFRVKEILIEKLGNGFIREAGI